MTVARDLRVSVALLAMALSSVVSAQSGKAEFGKREFESSCAVCHGHDGRGDGAYWKVLQQPVKAPDLTTVSKRNGGVFPVSRLYETIENGGSVASHGTRDMPIWGAVYREQAGNFYAGTRFDPDGYVRIRILALIEYIDRLQLR
jgi:mono/diheme cytochrome c family protein